MNRPLRRVSLAVLLLLVLLLGNLNYLQAVRAGELNNRQGNARVLLREYARERGPILLGDDAVARSVETDDALRYLRRYPEGPRFTHVTGYYTSVFGADGVERAANDVLAGTDERFLFSRVRDVLGSGASGGQQGGSVVLTLDARAQAAAEQGMRGRRGAVVALDPSTGAILAMTSSPSYDPNTLSSHDREAVTQAWDRLNADEEQPLRNRALRETYPPGSTFKLVTAAAALSTGRYRPDSELPGPARLPLPLTNISLPNFDEEQCTPGSDTTTLENALRRSCNTTFGALGLELGGDALREQAEKFGFGREFSVPMASAVSRFPADPNEPQAAQSAIGQFDVRATPLQIAMVAAGIANGGLVMRPYLVSQVLGPDLSPVDETRPDELARAVSPQVAAQLTQMMTTVVEEGTGSNARIEGVQVAGKTGTAQQGEDRPPHAWFVSFAPADSPEVAVAVLVEDGGGAQEISGNRLAAPVAKAVMEAVLRR